MAHPWKPLLLLLAAVVAASPAHAQQGDWQPLGYRQSHFQFELPPGFSLMQQARTGQGASFNRLDGATMSVWGAELPRRAFRDQIAAQMRQDEAEGWNLTAG